MTHGFQVSAMIQARLGSSRLPGKVLKSLGEVPMLKCIAQQIAGAKTVSGIVISTSDNPSDNAVETFAKAHSLLCSRKPVDDIVSRLSDSSKLTNADILVRVWGDCPFICPDVIDAMVELLIENELDYVTNGDREHRVFPPGLDAEVYRASFLYLMNEKLKDPFYREFPIEFVRMHVPPEKKAVFKSGPDLKHLHLTVDYQEDLDTANLMYALLYDPARPFTYKDLLRLIDDHPQIIEGFSNQRRNIEYIDELKKRQLL